MTISHDNEDQPVWCPTCLSAMWYTGRDDSVYAIWVCPNGHEHRWPKASTLGASQQIGDTPGADPGQRAIAEITLIKVALGRVALYEDLVEVSPTVRLVEELVRDHEDLESRIDAVLHYISSFQRVTYPVQAKTVMEEVTRLLRGGSIVPDSPAGLDG